MSVITKMRKQWAVYWAPIGLDKNNKYIYDEPVEIRCRWDERTERDFNTIGEEVNVKATVYVDREVALGGVLWLGLLVDSPSTPPEHNKIKIYRITPNRKASEFLRIARL